MASGFGARGSEGRCAPLWREFTKVRDATRREDEPTTTTIATARAPTETTPCPNRSHAGNARAERED
jgi:hypothetical protein